MRPVVARQSPATGVARSADAVLAALFSSRGVTADVQLDYAMKQLLPIRSLEHVADAVELILAHRDRHITVIGDFDVDGATSTALLLRCFRRFGFGNVDYLVPNRFDFGYGLSPPIVDIAAARQTSLIVTVDNGISSLDGVERARELGIDVLVTDHHLPPEVLPDANVIVNPNLTGSAFGSRSLAGVGVAFYVVAALGRRLEEQGVRGAARIPLDYLDLVALGTIADVVPLDHNNRILVSQGLKRMRAGFVVPGIRALMAVADRDVVRLVSQDLGFAVGPRLNAAGRLDDMSIGIECLLTDNDDTAMQHAAALDAINRERRDIEQTMREQAFAYVERMSLSNLPDCVCVYDGSWHQGVVGLVAGRVRERCHRPVIAFANDADGSLKGSMRSVPGVHARDLLEAVDTVQPGLITKFGGHAMAAGLTLPAKHLDTFTTLADTQLRRLYRHVDFSGAIVSDGELPPDLLSLEFARLLRERGPWGSGFPEPQWHGRFHVVDRRIVGEHHLKLLVRSVGGGASIDAIAFGQADAETRGVVELAYRLDVNAYRGVERAQLVVEQIRPLSPSDG